MKSCTAASAGRLFCTFFFPCWRHLPPLMVVGRLISGVHWLSDIIGSILLSAGLVLLYAGCQNRLTA